jgi:diguanylate cyclase (GGDEF)-like protein
MVNLLLTKIEAMRQSLAHLQTGGYQMAWAATKTQNGVNHFVGAALLSNLPRSVSSAGLAIAGTGGAPFMVAVLAYLLGATVVGFVPTAFAIVAGLIGVLGLVAMDHLHRDTAVEANPMAARLAAAQAKNDALLAALQVAQARLGRSIAERDSLAVELTIDPLTGLQNRRGLDAAFAAHGEGTVMALLDIDHFKKINDTLGHDAGDRVLRDFATRLRAALSDSLPVYRIGGEEFVVLFPQAEMETISALLADFRADLKASNVIRSDDRMTVSFSAGLALRADAAQSFDAVFKQADERLYVAKSTGRAKTVSGDDVARNVMAIAA